jgi:hypothetical protein
MGVCGTPWQIVDIDEVWPRIAPRIPADTPDADEIRSDCLAGAALCLQCADGVLVITLTPGVSGLELLVLLCVGDRPGAYQRRDPDLDKLAADLGASAIVMCPRRRGWARLLGPHWTRRADVFTREVIHHGGQARRDEADGGATSAG